MMSENLAGLIGGMLCSGLVAVGLLGLGFDCRGVLPVAGWLRGLWGGGKPGW